jgi:hypothetical protein
MNKIKRKVMRAGVELRVEQLEGQGYEFIGFFPNKLEAKVTAERSYRGKNFRITNVRADATPVSTVGATRTTGEEG